MEEFEIAPRRINRKYSPTDRLRQPLDWMTRGSSAQSQIRSRNVWKRFMWALLDCRPLYPAIHQNLLPVKERSP